MAWMEAWARWDAPTASYAATEGETVDIALTSSDVDNTATTFSLWYGVGAVETITTGAAGMVTLTDADETDNAATATYTPPTGYDGSDTFEFVAFDGTDYSSPTTVTLVVGSLPCISIDDVTVTEGDDGSETTADFTIVLSATSDSVVTVGYGTAADTAREGTDYTAVFGTLTFEAGVISQIVSVTVHGDSVFEEDDTFFVDLTAPSGAVLDDAQGVATISNDDGAPSIDVVDATAAEGENVTLTVTLSNASDAATSGDDATSDDTAAAASDYAAAAGTLTFAAGETTLSLAVTTTADAVNEADETFVLTLSDASGGSLGQSVAVVTIVDDDDLLVTVDDVTVMEDDAETPSATFTVTMSGVSEQTVTVDYSTSDGEAVAGEDYTAASGTLTIVPGATSATVDVDILSDDIAEDTETFGLTLSNLVARGVAFGSDVGTASIVDDDSLTISAADAEITEGDSADVALIFPVSLSRASGSVVTVDYVLSEGGTTPAALTAALAGATSGSVSFEAGETTADIVVAVAGDAVIFRRRGPPWFLKSDSVPRPRK